MIAQEWYATGRFVYLDPDFDGRDNEQAKARFYSAQLKVRVEPVLIASAA